MTLPSWTRAARLATQTPPERNRYVDLLRAASICLVILGHWLVVAIYTQEGTISAEDALSVIPWTQWLTWPFQVMPVFFLVGGYVNGLGWQSAQRRQEGYAAWLARRLQRLIVPVLPVLAAWTLIGAVLQGSVGIGSTGFYFDPFLMKIASQFALLPAWFLVVYILMVLLTPLSYRAWQRYGLASFWALAAAAALVDLLALGAGWHAAGWINYLFIWLAVHQLGFAWQAGRMGGPRRCLLWAAGGLIALIALVSLDTYPISMVSVGSEEISNSLPPRITLLALGAAQTGLLLALERPARRLLERGALWTTTVLINGMIMTVFLWHVTVLETVIALTFLTGGLETNYWLSFVPGTASWWLTRPLWIAVLVVALIPFAALFNRFERIGRARHGPAPPAWQLLLGCALVCLGLSILTLRGIPTATWPGINLLALGLPFVGAAFVWFGPRRARDLGE
ncbi:MAG: acyltransferase [Caldilineaceae bacterium SB0665_bin_25]|nr:acyltransferase [Caldilineaceae bacterium SB0665_bin_25]